MDLKEQLAKLETLRGDRSTWSTGANPQMLFSEMGNLTLVIEDDGELVTWELKDKVGHGIPQSPVASVTDAIAKSTDMTRSYLLAQYEPHPAQE